ncbi:MAG TPA: aspartate/glutamate racemase family protein [Ignavibacteria bacterium]|nr:aspartate/glutamate racemase family protein [Ignavibacteria bacterium]
MKTLGLIGGLSYVSTLTYYKTINELTYEKLGGENSARLLLYSLNFQDYRTFADSGNWQGMEDSLTEISGLLENAGAQCIVICSNTPHLLADKVRKRINLPLIHIAEETGKEIKKNNIKKIGLLGTKFTMDSKFYNEKLAQLGIETIIPDEKDRAYIHHTIINEFCKDIFKPETKQGYLNIIDKLKQQGIEGVILGCTEINLLLNQKDLDIKVFDTIQIHCKAAVDFSLS